MDALSNIMKTAFPAHQIAARRTAWGMCFLLLFFLQASFAGELKNIVWDEESPNTFKLMIDGPVDYEISSLEDGRRLRVMLPGSTLGTGVNELGGKDKIKGVYPYLAEGGKAINVDFLLTQPGELVVKKADYGLKVSARVAKEVAKRGNQSASSAPGSAIEDIAFTRLPGSRVQLRLKMSGPIVQPKSFTISNPARIALDFPNTRMRAPKKSVRVGVGSLVSVKAIEAGDRTRVVLNLVRPTGYQSDVIDNTLVITLDSPTKKIAAAVQPKAKYFSTKGIKARYSIEGIDFHRGKQGEGRLTVRLSDPSVGVDIREQAGDIILDFMNTRIPDELERRLDVIDFATPVQTIDAFGQGNNTRMVISAAGKWEHLAYQTGKEFTLNIKPVVEKEEEKEKDEFGYSGEKLSLNFQNIEVRAALQVLADFTNLNFVVSDTVTGELTLRLKDVPWDQALDLILDAKGLAMRRKGNVITVAPADEVAAKEKAELEAKKTVAELEPLSSELIQINYAKASEIAKLLKSIKAVTTEVGQHPVFGASATGNVVQAETESNSLLSPRGQVTVDDRTNSILVQDTPGKIREIRKLIAKLDQPIRQVLIESRLVEATENFSKSLGAKFGVSSNRTTGGVQVNQQATLAPDGSIFSPDGLNVNLPSGGLGGNPAGALALTIARLGTGALLSLELTALEQEGQGKIISSPRIVTANGQEAVIEQGQERVFTTNVLGVGSIITKKAVLKLEVTPRITPDDRVILAVVVTKDNFADSELGLLNIKEIRTEILLDNGETVVIGGIYELDTNSTDTRVPFFGNLPLLGWLFKNKEQRDSKTELLIFLTPKILSELASVR